MAKKRNIDSVVLYDNATKSKPIKSRNIGDEIVLPNKKETLKKQSELLLSAPTIKNGKLKLDEEKIAQASGFSNKSEMNAYKVHQRDLFEGMDKVRYIEPSADLSGAPYVKKYDDKYAKNLSNLYVNEIIERVNNSDESEVNFIIDDLNKNEWKDKETLKKYSDKIDRYVKDRIVLDEIGYFNSLSENERRTNLESLKEIKDFVDAKKNWFTSFGSKENYMKTKDVVVLPYEEQLQMVRNYRNANNTYEAINEDIETLEESIAASILPQNTENIKEAVTFFVDWYNDNNTFVGAREAYGKSKGYVTTSGKYDRLMEKSSALLDQAERKATLEVKYGDEAYVKKRSEELLEYWENTNTGKEFLKYYEKMENDPKKKQYIEKGKKIYETKNKNISDKEYDVVCYYLGKGEKNNNYFTWLEDNVYKREVAAKKGWSAVSDGESLKYHRTWSDFAKDAPLEANAMSVALNLGAGIETAYNMINGDVKESKLSKASSTIREAYANTHDWNVLGFDAHDFLYNTMMSGIDSYAAMTTGGGGYLLGLSAAAAGVNDALERGMSDTYAFWNGLMSGIFECFFEKYSIGELKALKTSKGADFKTFVKNLSREMLVNASEEGATEFANMVYDVVVNNNLSNYAQSVQKYMDSGLTKKQAKFKANKEMIFQLVEAAASGAAMGAGFSVIGSVSATKNASKYGELYYGFSDKSINALVKNGLEMPVGSVAHKSAQNAEKKISSGQKLSGKQLYNLATSIEREIETKSAKRLNKFGVDRSTAKELSPIVAKAVFGEKLTAQEREIIGNSNIAIKVVNELAADKANTVWKDVIKPSNTQTNYTVHRKGGLYENAVTNEENGSYDKYSLGSEINNENGNIESSSFTQQKTAPTENAYNIENKELSDERLSNKPLKISKKELVKINSARAEKYSKYNKDEIPDIDFFDIVDYNQNNATYKYCVRNYDEYNFEVVSKTRFEPKNSYGYLEEENEDARTHRGEHEKPSEDTKLLERGTIRATNRRDNLLRKSGANSEKLATKLEVSSRSDEKLYGTMRAGESGWPDGKPNTTGEKERKRFKESISGKIRGVKLGDRDTDEYNFDVISKTRLKPKNSYGYLEEENEDARTHRREYEQSSEDAKLLERGTIQATNRGDNILWESSTNSEKLAVCLGVSKRINQNVQQTIRAGESGWLAGGQTTNEKARQDINGSIFRKIRGVKLSGRDTVGRTISTQILEKFANTVFKNENGDLISLYHWTKENFIEFKNGEFGFHFGTLQAAIDRRDEITKDTKFAPIGVYKEVVLNIENPLEISDENGQWTAGWVAFQLLRKGIITEDEFNEIIILDGIEEPSYENTAAVAVRRILTEKGYDGIIYINKSEDVGSYSVISLYPEQIITIAENGVLKENNGITSTQASENQYSDFESLYSEEEYNNYGWVRYNEVLSSKEYTVLLSRYADYKHNQNKYPITKFGEAVIHSGECPSVLMYVKGKIGNPKITKVVKIKTEEYNIADIKENILHYEYEQRPLPYEDVKIIFGEEILTINKKRDFITFQEYASEREGKLSKRNSNYNRELFDRNRSAGKSARISKADSLDESAFSFDEDIQRLRDDKAFKLTEPDIDDIKISKETQFLNGINGEDLNKAQMHIIDLAKRLNPNISVEFVENLDSSGRYIPSQNKILIKSDLAPIQMYVEVFKHEFMHTLERKESYGEFLSFCFKESKAFEQYVRSSLKQYKNISVDDLTREDALSQCVEHKYNQYKNSKVITKTARDAFTIEDARREIVADFFAKVLFKGEKYRNEIIEALENTDGKALANIGDVISSEDALFELCEKDIGLFKKLVQWIKNIFEKLRFWVQGKLIAKDIECDILYLEGIIKQLYGSKEIKNIDKKAYYNKNLVDKYSLEFPPHELKNDAKECAKYFVKKYDSKADEEKIAKIVSEIAAIKENSQEENLQEVFDYSGEYIGELSLKERLINEIAVRVSENIVPELEEYAKEVMSYVKENRIYINSKQRLQIKRMYGSLTNYHNSVGVRLSTHENPSLNEEWISLDEVWESFIFAYSELFNSIIGSEEMPARLAEIMEYINTLTEEIDYEEITEKIIEDLYSLFGDYGQYQENLDANEGYRTYFAEWYRENIKYDEYARNKTDEYDKEQYELIKIYTKPQYEKLGWTVYNGIVTNDELNSFVEKYKNSKEKFAVTRFDEVVVHNDECPNIIMYMKGTKTNPLVTRVVKINRENPTEIKDEILYAELENDLFALVSAAKIYDGEVEIHQADAEISYWEYQRQLTKIRNAKATAILEDAKKAANKKVQIVEEETVDFNSIWDEEKEYRSAYCFVKCYDEEKISKAEAMEQAGNDNVTIWRELKIFRGIFGDWIRMIETNKFAFYAYGNAKASPYEMDKKTIFNDEKSEKTLADFIRWKELFKLFPKFKKIAVRIVKSDYDTDTVKYVPYEKKLIINKKYFYEYIYNKNQILRIHLVREIQRMIQFEEGKYIGKNFDYWKELENSGKLPFFEKLNRTLTAEDMMKYYIDNYEAELAARMVVLNNVVDRTENGKVKPTKELVLYAPKIEPDVALVYDDHKNLMTVREKDIASGENNFINFSQNTYYWELLKEYVEDNSDIAKIKDYYGKYYSEELFNDAYNMNLFKENIVEYGDSSMVIKNFVALGQKTRFGQQMVRKRKDIRGGNSGFLEDKNQIIYEDSQNKKDMHREVDVTSREYKKHLYSKSVIPIASNDTIGRRIDSTIQEKLKNTIFKNNAGEPLSLYTFNIYGKRDLTRGRLGIVLGTINMAFEKYNAEIKGRGYKKIDACEEYYVVVKKPLILSFEPYELSVEEIGFWMTEEFFVSRKEYFDMVDKFLRVSNPKYNNVAFKRIRKRLKEYGYDSIIYANQNYDANSLSVVVFDKEQLIPVAKNGVVIANSGITDDIKHMEFTDTNLLKRNNRIIKECLKDAFFIQRKYRKKPDERIMAGSSDWFESTKGDLLDEYNKTIESINGKSEIEYNKYNNPLDREYDSTLIKRLEKTAFKTNDGNFISFYIWSKKEIENQKIEHEGIEFKNFNGAFKTFIEEKKRVKYSYNGIFYEYFINSVNPWVVQLEGWNTKDIVNLLYEKNMISNAFYEEIVSHPHFDNPKYTNYAAKKLRNKIELLGYDSIIFIKNSGEKALIVFDENQIITIAQNGISETNSGILLPQNEFLEKDVSAESVVIDRTDRPYRDVDKMEKSVLALKDNTEKLLWLTEYMACTNNPSIEEKEDIIVGHSSLLESKINNIWMVYTLLDKIISDAQNTKLLSYDVAGRELSSSIQQKYKDTIFKDGNGRLLSLFVWNKYGDKRHIYSAFPYVMSSLNAARKNYLIEKQEHKYLTKGDFEEYYVNVKNPYLMLSAPQKLNAEVILYDMYMNGVLSKGEHRIATARKSVDWTHRDNVSIKNLGELLKEKGFDSVVFLNKQNNGISVIVFDEKNLCLVSKNGMTIVPKSKFVEKNRKKTLDESSENEYDDNVREIKCINRKLKGKRHPVTGVLFEEKIFEVNGQKTKAVLPSFESFYDAQLPENLYLARDRVQKKECFKQLAKELETNEELRKALSEKEIERIKQGKRLKKFVWHHSVPPGKMSLVLRDIHDKTGHTGGRSIWGGGSKYR